jgi:hypothetical protein
MRHQATWTVAILAFLASLVSVSRVQRGPRRDEHSRQPRHLSGGRPPGFFRLLGTGRAAGHWRVPSRERLLR